MPLRITKTINNIKKVGVCAYLTGYTVPGSIGGGTWVAWAKYSTVIVIAVAPGLIFVESKYRLLLNKTTVLEVCVCVCVCVCHS